MEDPFELFAENEIELLQERAKHLAQASVAEESAEATDEVLVLGIDDARYAISLVYLSNVVQLEKLTPLPGAPPSVAGLAAIEGEVISVVDTGTILSGTRCKVAVGVVVGSMGERIALGFDCFYGIEAHPGADLLEIPAGLSEAAQRCVRGVTQSGVGLLDIDRLYDELSMN